MITESLCRFFVWGLPGFGMNGDIRSREFFLDSAFDGFCQGMGFFERLGSIHQDVDVHEELRS
jgi:hypothetical protein